MYGTTGVYILADDVVGAKKNITPPREYFHTLERDISHTVSVNHTTMHELPDIDPDHIAIQNLCARLGIIECPIPKLHALAGHMRLYILRSHLYGWRDTHLRTLSQAAEQLIPVEKLTDANTHVIYFKKLEIKAYVDIGIELLPNNTTKFKLVLQAYSIWLNEKYRRRTHLYNAARDDVYEEGDYGDPDFELEHEMSLHTERCGVDYTHTVPAPTRSNYPIGDVWNAYLHRQRMEREQLPLELKEKIRNTAFLKLRAILPQLQFCDQCKLSISTTSDLCRYCICENLCCGQKRKRNS